MMKPPTTRPLRTLALCGLFLAASLAVLPAEEAAAPAGETAGAHAAHKEKTFIDVLREGGIVMIPLGLVSVYMLTLIIDSARRIRIPVVCPPHVVSILRAQFSQGDYQAAFQTCREKPSFLTNIVRVGLGTLGQGKEVSEKAMEDTMAKEIAAMNTRIYYLNLIGVVTPMIGLTGTVIGMMGAFKTLGTSGIGDPSALAGAIGEVLVATASGLFVAIPGFAAYYIFRNRIHAVSSHAEEVINHLFRGMPYAYLANMAIGDEPICAAIPKEYYAAEQQPAYHVGEQPAEA